MTLGPAVARAGVGEGLEPVTIPPVSKKQLVRYAGASGDFNPIHWDADFARDSGYDGPIAHGMLTMAFFGRAALHWAGTGGWVVGLTTRFKAVTYPGDALTVSGKVVSRREDPDGSLLAEIELEATRADGTVTATGTAEVRARR